MHYYCGPGYGNPYKSPTTETKARTAFYKRRKVVYSFMVLLVLALVFLRWFAANIYDTMTFIHNNYLGQDDGLTISIIRWVFTFFL